MNDSESHLEQVEWKVMCDKIIAAMSHPSYVGKPFEGNNSSIPQTVIEQIKAMKEEFGDDLLFNTIASGAGFGQILSQWREEKTALFVDSYAKSVFAEVSVIDPSITMLGCKRFIAQAGIAAALS